MKKQISCHTMDEPYESQTTDQRMNAPNDLSNIQPVNHPIVESTGSSESHPVDCIKNNNASDDQAESQRVDDNLKTTIVSPKNSKRSAFSQVKHLDLQFS